MQAVAIWLSVRIYHCIQYCGGSIAQTSKRSYHTCLCIQLEAMLNFFCRSVVICSDGSYTERSNDIDANAGVKSGLCYTCFLLMPLHGVPTKNSPHGGQ